MAFEAVRTPMQRDHLYGDVPALVLAAVILGVLSRPVKPSPTPS